MRSIRNSLAFVTALASIGPLLSSAASAADWKANPRIAVSAGHDDNYLLSFDPAQQFSVESGRIEAGVDFVGRTPTGSYLIAPAITSSFLSNHSDLNATDGFLTLGGQHTGEKSVLNGRIDLSRQQLLRDALPDSDIGSNLGNPLSGQVLGRTLKATQDLVRVTPSGQWQLTQRTRFTADVQYLDANYDRRAEAFYTDFRNIQGSAGLAFETSQRGVLTARLLAGNFDPAVGPSANTYGGQLEFSRQLTEISRYYVRAGVDHVTVDSTPAVAGQPARASQTLTRASGGAGIDWQYQVTTLFLDYTRRVDPNPSGHSVAQDQLRARIERRVSPGLALFASGRAIRNLELGGYIPGVTTPPQERRYLTASAGLEWRYRREWSLLGAYIYSWQKQSFVGSAVDPFSADSNAVRLTLVWEPNRPVDGPAVTREY